jgi:coenzyme F420-reducing hydrogenase beta subunit
MIDFDFNIDCCGCFSCENACPVSAIKIKENGEGFNIPAINKELCIECGMCEKACPHINTITDKTSYSELFKYNSFYLYHSNAPERINSASGGFVYDLYTKYHKEGGYFSGCIWDDNFLAHHIVSNQGKDIQKMQSSKYVQSNINSCFAEIKRLLEMQHKVIFCGTPCQTAGLSCFLQKKYNNLLLVSLICHGVPSPKVWHLYKKDIEHKIGSKLISVNMRDKQKYGYKKTCCKYIFENGKILNSPTYLSDIYVSGFLYNLYLRNSCHQCYYKRENSHADIIVGDYHISKDAENKGVSIVIICTEKGYEEFQQLKGNKEKVSKEIICSINPLLYQSAKNNANRNRFFSEVNKSSNISEIINRHLPLRFHLKKRLNQIGLFDIMKNVLTLIKFLTRRYVKNRIKK